MTNIPQPYYFINREIREALAGRYQFDATKAQRAFSLYDLPVVENLEDAVELAVSGNVIAFPMKFIGNTYKRYDSSGRLIDTEMPDFRLPALVLGSFSRSKLMTVTDLGSGRGSVKELDGHSDWSIELTGIIVPEDNHPNGVSTFQAMLESMAAWDSLMSSIEVSSEILTALGIYKVVIKSISISQQEGIEDNVDFTMSLLSDEEFELEIIE
jgi:hypothetical protein